MSTGRGDLADNEPAPEGKAGPPAVGPTTAAMRLRPRGRVAEPEPEKPRTVEAVSAVRGARALEQLLELHTGSHLTRLCRECLTAAPCQTRRLLEVVAGTSPTPEEGSQ